MKKLTKATLFGAVAVLGLIGQETRGAAVPAVLNVVPFAQFQNQRSETGPDGNNRFIWDYYATQGTTLTQYEGSALWILGPGGNVVATGPTIPVVGNLVGGNGSSAPQPTAFSNIALHVAADNNTTLAFAYWGPNRAYVSSFGTWTLNAQGTLIAASGPVGFQGLQIIDIAFRNDSLVIIFAPVGQSNPGASGPFTVWVVNEFGNLVSAAGPQGPHQGYSLESVTLSGPSASPNQLWHWVGAGGKPLQIVMVAQEFNSSGLSINGAAYGPF